jgi:hypothetical protein
MGKAGRRTGGFDALDVAALWPASAQQSGFPIPHIVRDRDEPRTTPEEEPR